MNKLIQDIIKLDMKKFAPPAAKKEASPMPTASSSKSKELTSKTPMAFKKRDGSQSIPTEEIKLEIQNLNNKRRSSENKSEVAASNHKISKDASKDSGLKKRDGGKETPAATS